MTRENAIEALEFYLGTKLITIEGGTIVPYNSAYHEREVKLINLVIKMMLPICEG